MSKLYVRKPPPVAVQALMGAAIYGIGWPAIRAAEALGYGTRFMAAMSAANHKRVEEKNPFRAYVPGPQDVFVMTMPKSGTNWTMQIAHQLIWHGKGEYSHVHDVVPWPDTAVMPGFMQKYAVPIEQATAWTAAPERKRVIKTHFHWELLPESDQARYIGVIRDPKDVFVSSYFFIRDGIYGPAMWSVDTWFRAYVSGVNFMGLSWPEATASYWRQRHRPNVLLLSFKTMKRDLEGTVRRIAAFLDIDVPDAVIRDVVRQSTFEYMRDIDHKFSMGRVIPWQKPGRMLRKGAQGGSSELLSAAQQREVDAYCQAELTRLGCDLPYEEFADPAPPV
jgi:hypothetical protein